jgi:hypothetical protein
MPAEGSVWQGRASEGEQDDKAGRHSLSCCTAARGVGTMKGQGTGKFAPAPQGLKPSWSGLAYVHILPSCICSNAPSWAAASAILMHPDAGSIAAYTAAHIYCVVQHNYAFVCAAPQSTVYGQYELLVEEPGYAIDKLLDQICLSAQPALQL